MSRHPDSRRAQVVRALIVPVMLTSAIVLGGCSGASAPPPSPTATPSATSTAEESGSAAPVDPVPAAPTLVPDGSAQDNLPLFASVVSTVAAGPESGVGRAYIDALVAAGFDKAAMQVTFDQSTIGNPAESIQFSVLWSTECLIGQVGPASGAPLAVVVPSADGSSCLIGSTRPIDW